MCSPLIRSYLCNYARPLIFSTAMNHSNVVSIHCSFDLLENATAEKVSFSSSTSPVYRARVSYLLGVPFSLHGTYSP